MKTAIILGTRPEIIKCFPIISELKKRNADFFAIDTGQHTDPEMQDAIYKSLDLEPCKYMLQGYSQEQTPVTIRKILEADRPDTVLVHGDTDSTLIGAMAAASLGINLVHNEAGLRSGTLWMKEERNRILTDHACHHLFAPTRQAEQNLLLENVRASIEVTGNTIVDALHYWRDKNPRLTKTFSYALLTMHRAESVDNRETLASILHGIDLVSHALELTVFFPVHPRTKKRLEEFKIDLPSCVMALQPMDYFLFLEMEANADLVLTDSGGVQEEACSLMIPCVTLRYSTERPETVEIGANELSGTDSIAIRDKAKKMFKSARNWVSPYGDGKASVRVADYLERS